MAASISLSPGSRETFLCWPRDTRSVPLTHKAALVSGYTKIVIVVVGLLTLQVTVTLTYSYRPLEFSFSLNHSSCQYCWLLQCSEVIFRRPWGHTQCYSVWRKLCMILCVCKLLKLFPIKNHSLKSLQQWNGSYSITSFCIYWVDLRLACLNEVNLLMMHPNHSMFDTHFLTARV